MAIKSFLSEGGFSVGSVGSAPIEVIDSSGNITAVGLTVSGNLVVNGSTTTINSTTTTLDDPIFTLGGDTVPTSDDNKDRGIEFRWHDGSLAKVGFFGFDDSTGKFVFIPNATNTSEVFSGTKGTIDANLEWADVLSKPSPVVTVTLTGDVTGTANATLTSLGNGTVTISTTVAADSVALGTDTTGAYVQAINNGSYLTGGNGPSGSESAVLTLAVDATSANTASKVVARDASGNFSAGTITATGGVIASGLTANSWLFEARGTAVYGGFAQYGNNIKSVQYWNASNTISVGSSYSANVANDGDLIVSGKIGVGTLSPGGKLEVNFTAATGATALILRTSDSGANGAIRWQNSGGTNQAGIGSNFNVSDVGALEFLNGTTTNVIFRSSGSVGIGITAPEAALHVAKTGADEQLILGSAATNRDISMAMYSGTTKAEVLRFQSAFRLMHGASNSITQQSFFTSGGERLTIVSGGNIGIGTASPGAKLHIAGPHADESADRAATTALIVDTRTDGNGDGKTYIKTGWVNSGNYGVSTLAVGYYSASRQVRDVITMLGTGSVGVGVSSPGAKLHVSEASGVGNFAALKLTNTVTSVNANVDIIMEAGGQVGARIRAIAPGASHNDLAMYVTNSGTLQATPAIFIQGSTNRVGINRSDPSNTLDVNGSVRTTDWYYVDGSGFGMYNNANAMWWASYGSGSYSLSSNTTFSGIKLFSGGAQNTFRGHFYGDSSGQGFLDSGGNWQLTVDSSSRLRVYAGVYNMDSGIRVLNPGGAAYSTNSSTITGAWKIKLPTDRFKSNTMMRMTIKIYRYSTGTSTEFNVGGYNYSDAAANWYNIFAEQQSDLYQAAYTIRFGNDGTANCIWIGETNSTWDYPQVFVTDFEGGYSGTTQTWASGWSITPVTAFDTVTQSRTAAVQVNSNNIGNFGVNYITGTTNQVLVNGGSGANVTGGVTLTLPQNIHTAATPTFGGGTLNGTLTVVKSNGGNVNGSANAAIYLSQDESSIQGPGTNTVIRMGGNLVLGANSTWIAATNGTAAITVNNSQNATFAGDATFNKNGNIQVTLSTASTTAGATNRLRFITPASTADVRSGVIEWYKDGSTFMGDLRFKVAGGIEIRNSADQLSFTTDDSKNATVYGNVSVAGDVQVGTSAGGLKAYRIYGWSGSGAGTAGTLDIQPYGNKTTIGGIFEVSGASSFFSSVTISGNLTVNGTTTTVNSTVSTIKDPVITLGGGDAGTAAASDDNKDRGIEFKWHNGTSAKTGFFGFDDSTGYLIFIPDATNTSEVFSGTLGDIQASNFRGNLIGNVTGNVSGSAGSVATLTAGTYLTGGSFNGSTNVTFAVDATSANTAGKVVARDANGSFSAGASNFIGPATTTAYALRVAKGNYADSGGHTTFLGFGAETTSWSKGAIGWTRTGSYDTGQLGFFINTGTADTNSAATSDLKMVILGNGNVGIGLAFGTAPGYKLEVSGNGYFSGALSSGGTITGTSFSGPLANTLTLNTNSGAGLSGSATFNNSGAATFTVTSNATSVNTASTIVFRDGSGNFSAGTVTAALSGNATTATTWQTARNFTIGSTARSVNGSADVTWTLADIGAAAASHNHTSLTGVTSIGFAAEGSDSASISTTISSTQTFFDFNLTDDNNNDLWRWRFTPSGSTVYNAMTLSPSANGVSDLVVAGTITGTRLISNVATGTAPLTVASTTLVTNLNADLLDGLNSATGNTASTIVARDSSGNFSAGTITATLAGLATSETLSTVTGRGASTGSQISVATGSGGSMFTGTKVGSGYSDGVSGATFKSITDNPNGGSTAFAAYYGGSAGTNSFYVTAVGSAYFKDVVGIGTTSPVANLHVYRATNSTVGNLAEVATYSAVKIGKFRADQDHSLYIGNAGSYASFLQGANDAGSNSMNILINPFGSNVGIGTTSPGYKLEVNGSFAATTKSFVIKHPTKEGKKLRYGSLEGPENGVYVRGKLKGSNIIELPDYWTKLVDPESITVQLTPIGSHQKLYVEKIEDNKVYIANENLLAKAINCFFYVLAERCDVEKLEVEIDA